MESKIEYIDKTAQDIKLPREVYYRCLWTVRDVTSLRQLADTASLVAGSMSEYPDREGTIDHGRRQTFDEGVFDHSRMQTSDDDTYMILSERVVKQAASDIRCIQSALEHVPDVYRKGIMDNIVMKTPFDDLAHPNTWKRWKLVFLYELARELNYI